MSDTLDQEKLIEKQIALVDADSGVGLSAIVKRNMAVACRVMFAAGQASCAPWMQEKAEYDALLDSLDAGLATIAFQGYEIPSELAKRLREKITALRTRAGGER